MIAAAPKDTKGAAKEKPKDSKKLDPEAHEDDDKDDVPKGLTKTKTGTAKEKPRRSLGYSITSWR